MDVETYLKQGRLLDQRINYHLRKLSELRQTAYMISSPQISGCKVQNSHTGEAPFEKALERIEAMEERINQEIDLLVALKEQIEGVIRELDNEEYQMVLIYKYLEGLSWGQIGDLLHIGKNTAIRWNLNALSQIKMPEKPISIKSWVGLGRSR